MLIGVAGACAPTAEQQGAALSRAGEAAGVARARDSRSFETPHEAQVLRAAIGALQDSGFTIEETQPAAGLVTASKVTDARIRAQVVVRQQPNRDATLVRVTFQSVSPRPGAMLDWGAVLVGPLLYRDFFERVSQSLFLTANEI